MVTMTLVVVMSLVGPAVRGIDGNPDAAPSVAMRRVRAVTDSARMLLDTAVARSPTIAHLVQQLQAARVFVFLDTRLDPAVPTGPTSLLTSTAEGRYLHVVLNPALGINQRIELLGHELQHALEFANADALHDSDSVRRHFTEIGRPLGVPNGREAAFETDAAQDVERKVRRDLAVRIRDAI